jgi:hypothetical protein
MSETAGSFVLFLDMLGFASIVDEYPQTTEEQFRWLSGRITITREWSSHVPRGLRFDNELIRRFNSFHELLDATVAKRQVPWNIQHVITFSDSAFITTPTLKEAVALAASVAQAMLLAQVPVRIGIGYGTFLLVRFRSDTALSARVHQSQFLGTSVTTAYHAERSGHKGIRCLIHENANWALQSEDLTPPQIIPIPSPMLPTVPIVQYEVNYLHPGNADDDLSLFEAVQSLRCASQISVAHQYAATTEALNRMRVARSRSPIYLTP